MHRLPPARRPPPPPRRSDWADLLSHRAYLVRFAQRKLQDPALAEDVVHDVFEAVLRRPRRLRRPPARCAPG